MNEKISFPDLVALLAAKLNVTKKEAEAFLKEFFTISTEVISSGEELRINELGVFKPIWVEPRASVNVQTGEPVEIPGHYKLSFVPDKVLREAVNAPFSSFSVEILNDHVSTEAMMAVDEDEPLDSIGIDSPGEEDLLAGEPSVVMSADSDATGEVAPATETERVEPEVVPADEIADSESLTDAVPETPVSDPNSEMPAASEKDETTVAETEAEVETPPTIEPIEATPASATEEQAVKTSALVPVDTEEERDYHEYLQKSASRRAFWLGALSGLGAVAVIVAAVWFFLRDDDGIKIGEYTLSLTGSEVFTPQPVTNPVADTVVIPEAVDTVVEGVATSADTVSLTRESVSQNVKTNGQSAQVAPAVGQPSSELVIETIRSGVFLTTLSRKYFGHKAFWVYIYEENKGVIKNPNQVPIGTRVVIPDAAKYHIDAKNSRSVDEAKALAVKILSRYE